MKAFFYDTVRSASVFLSRFGALLQGVENMSAARDGCFSGPTLYMVRTQVYTCTHAVMESEGLTGIPPPRLRIVFA